MDLRKVFLLSSSAIKAMIATRPPPQVINEKRDDGFTPLHIAIVKEYVEVAALLIQEVVITYRQEKDLYCHLLFEARSLIFE